LKQFSPVILLWLFQLSVAIAQSGPLGTCTSICNGSLGDNIYPNGDFGSGISNVVPVNPGLAPGYIYQTNPPPNDGFYSIANSTAPWGWFAANVWIDIEDNGPEPNGYMMVVNASYPPGMFFQNTVEVCEGTLYEFSVDVINIFKGHFTGTIYPNLTFMIDNVAYCETGDISNDEQWHTVRFSFTTAPGQTSLLLGMRNNAPGGYGNDLAIDNISFRACGPELLAPDTLWFCAGSSAQLQLQSLNSPFSSTVYQWQVLLNNNWEDIPGADSLTWNVPNPQDGAAYRLLAASAIPNLAIPNCRVVSQAIRLVELPALLVSASGSDVLCYGMGNTSVEAQVFSGQAPYNYAWNNGSTDQMLADVAAGNYQVTITDAQGCSASTSVAVNEAPELVTGIIPTPVSCFGGSNGQAIAYASGGTWPYTFSWETGQTSAQVGGLNAGPYTVTLTDAHGCSASTSVSISEPSALVPAANWGATSCFGGNDAIATASASGGTSPYTFLWNTGQTSAQVSGLSSGPYNVTLTDAHGCSASTTGNIQEPGLLVANTLAGAVSCFGGNNATASAQCTGGTGPYYFLWNNGQTTAQLAGLSAGTYTVTATDAQGCTAVQWASVDQSALLVSTAVSVVTPCFGGNDGAVSIQSNGGQAPYQYQWSNGQSGTSMSGLAAGLYSVTTTDALGCTTINTTVVGQPTPVVLNVTSGSVSCFGGANGSLMATTGGGTGPYSIAWSNGQIGITANGLSAGTYTLTATDAQGCTASSSAIVITPTAIVSDITAQDPDCFGGANGMANLLPNGGTPPYSYQWQNGQTGASAQQLSAGSYQVTIIDAHGCTYTSSTSLGQPTQVSGNVQALEADCFGAATGQAWSSPSGGTPPYSFSWQNGQTTPQINGLTSGWYGLSITDAHQCTGAMQVWVGQPTPLSVVPVTQPVSCPEVANGIAYASASGGVEPYLFAWSNGQSGPEISALVMGTYTVTATDAQGCTAVAVEMVDSELPIEVDLGLDLTFFLGDELVLTAHTNVPPGLIQDYSWSGAGGSAQCANCYQYQFVPLESGCERVIVTTLDGCQASDEVCFKIRPGKHLYVPNVFHPDDSGDNDFFTIFSDASVKQILYLNIYSRWGEQLFQTKNIQTNHEPSGWDGNFRGNPMNPGVFVWVAEVEFIDGQVLFLKGDVTLVR
jgi:gliding motility-associated-like protein